MRLSLVTCTYNPDSYLFNRLILSISKLAIPGNCSVEWIVVDNNSRNCVEKAFDFTSVKIPVLQIVERKQGLTYARLSGIRGAKGEWVVFFDDDNEPAVDYLIGVVHTINNYEKLKCFGPGIIEVKYIGQVSPWVAGHPELFQQKNEPLTIHDHVGWDTSYPPGTGQVVEKKILLEYLDKVENGLYTVKGRTGKALSSGEDVQIVYLTLRLGFSVGVTPDLKLNHLIQSHKATLAYLYRLRYYAAASYFQLYNQVFPEHPMQKENATSLKIAKDVFQFMRSYKHRFFHPECLTKLFKHLGYIRGMFWNENKLPFPLRIADKILSIL